jgi:hypothetical protein
MNSTDKYGNNSQPIKPIPEVLTDLRIFGCPQHGAFGVNYVRHCAKCAQTQAEIDRWRFAPRYRVSASPL